VQSADVRQHAIGLRARPEIDLLEGMTGVDEAPERRQLSVRALRRNDIVQRGQRADAERTLAVHEPDDVLLVNLAQQ
jgi:hypothetical protein